MTKTIVFITSLAAAVAAATPASADEGCVRIDVSKKSAPCAKLGKTAPATTPAKTPAKAPASGARHEVPASKAVPSRAVADSLFYLRLGEGAVLGGQLQGGPALGFGYRFELDRIGIDASVNLGITGFGKKDKLGYYGSWAKLATQVYLDPTADRTAYVGGGLSWGAQSIGDPRGERFFGSGLQGEVIAGYEFLRSSTIRIFLQANATLPFYVASREHLESPTTGRDPATPRAAAKPVLDTRYLPILGLSLGIGWGKPSSVGVRKVE